MSKANDPAELSARIRALEQEAAKLRLRLDSGIGEVKSVSEERYRSLVDNINAGVAVYEAADDGADFVFRELNRAGARFEQVQPEEVAGRRVTEVFPGVRDFGLFEVFQRVWRTGIPEHHPVSLYQDDRIAGWRDNYVYRLATGEVVAAYTDATEQKQAEEALIKSETRFRSIAETALDSIFAKDREHRYTFVNPAMTRLLGCEAEDLLGKTPEQLFDPDSAGLIREVDDAVFSGREISEVHQLSIGGKPMFLHTVQVPMRRENGRVVDICGIVRDITDNMRAEEEIRRLNLDLEALVRERTAELEAANQELEAFAYSVSHDLRGPLRSIDGFGRTLEEIHGDELHPDAQHCISRMQAAVSRMSGLIDGLLILSRVTRRELDRQSCNLGSLALQVAAELGEMEPLRKVSFETRGDLRVDGDERLLRAALENLLGNAWKFTRNQDSAQIELFAETIAGRKVITVRDNGVGFDMRFKDKLFGTFQRLHLESEFEGTGIGLATVKRIVHRHGGRIWAESQVGHGASIHFTLSPPNGPT